MVQLAFFIVFLILYYKQRNVIAPSSDAENNASRVKLSNQMIRIAVAMGASIGVARIAWLAALLFSPKFFIVGAVALIIQQFVVMASFTCTKKMSRMCRERFCSALEE